MSNKVIIGDDAHTLLFGLSDISTSKASGGKIKHYIHTFAANEGCDDTTGQVYYYGSFPRNSLGDTNRFVQLIPGVVYQWSGPDVCLINQYHLGVSTGSTLVADGTVKVLPEAGDCGCVIKSGTKFKLPESQYTHHLTYFKCLYSSSDVSGALIMNYAGLNDTKGILPFEFVKSPFGNMFWFTEESVSKYWSFNSALPLGRALSDSRPSQIISGIGMDEKYFSKKCVIFDDIVSTLDYNAYESGISVTLTGSRSTGKWDGSKYVLLSNQMAQLANNVSLALKVSISGSQTITPYAKLYSVASGALVARVSGVSGKMPTSSTSWSGKVSVKGKDHYGVEREYDKSITIYFSIRN